jgi:hypothetical protein
MARSARARLCSLSGSIDMISLFLFVVAFAADALAQSNMAFSAASTTFRLTQSIANFVMWTAPSSRRIVSTDTAPVATGSQIKIDAAKQEYEPFQIIIAPPATQTTFTVSLSAFSNLGPVQNNTLEVASFDGGSGVTGQRITDFMAPVASPATLLTTEPYVLWVTVFVPPGMCERLCLVLFGWFWLFGFV